MPESKEPSAPDRISVDAVQMLMGFLVFSFNRYGSQQIARRVLDDLEETLTKTATSEVSIKPVSREKLVFWQGLLEQTRQIVKAHFTRPEGAKPN